MVSPIRSLVSLPVYATPPLRPFHRIATVDSAMSDPVVNLESKVGELRAAVLSLQNTSETSSATFADRFTQLETAIGQLAPASTGAALPQLLVPGNDDGFPLKLRRWEPGRFHRELPECSDQFAHKVFDILPHSGGPVPTAPLHPHRAQHRDSASSESDACAEALFRLRQTGSLPAYIAEFHRLATRASTVSSDLLLCSFIGGLRWDIKSYVRKRKPETTEEAIALAVQFEQQHLTPPCDAYDGKDVIGIDSPSPVVMEPLEGVETIHLAAPECPVPTARQLFDELPDPNGGVSLDFSMGYHLPIDDKGGGLMGSEAIPLKSEEQDVYVQNVERTVSWMGERPAIVEDVRCGNTVSRVGLDKFIPKNTALPNEEDVDVSRIRPMKFSISPITCVGLQCNSASELPKLVEYLKHLATFAPMVVCSIEEHGDHIIDVENELVDNQFFCQVIVSDKNSPGQICSLVKATVSHKLELKEKEILWVDCVKKFHTGIRDKGGTLLQFKRLVYKSLFLICVEHYVGGSISLDKQLLDALRLSLRFKNVPCQEILKELNSLEKHQDHKVLDIWLLMLIYMNGESLQIIEDYIHGTMLDQCINGHKDVQDYFLPFIYLSEYLLVCNEPKAWEFGIHIYACIFEEFADTYSRQEVLGLLLMHVGSSVGFQVTSALETMALLSSKFSQQLIPPYINDILDYLEGFSIENLQKVYEICGHLALLARSSADSYGSSFANKLLMIVRKQVHHPDLNYKKMGLVGTLKIVPCLGDATDATCSSSYEKSNSDEALKLLRTSLDSCKQLPLSLIMLRDELTEMLDYKMLHPTVLDWIGKHIGDFESIFLADLDGEKFSLLSDDTEQWLSKCSLVLIGGQSVKAYTAIFFKLNEWNYGKAAHLALQFISLPLSVVQDVLQQLHAMCSEPKHRTERVFVVGNWFSALFFKFPIQTFLVDKENVKGGVVDRILMRISVKIGSCFTWWHLADSHVCIYVFSVKTSGRVEACYWLRLLNAAI